MVDMPEFRPDVNLPGLGMIEYVSGLARLKNQRNEDGSPVLTDERFKELVTEAHTACVRECARLDALVLAMQRGG